jgi:hypothetical protein
MKAGWTKKNRKWKENAGAWVRDGNYTTFLTPFVQNISSHPFGGCLWRGTRLSPTQPPASVVETLSSSVTLMALFHRQKARFIRSRCDSKSSFTRTLQGFAGHCASPHAPVPGTLWDFNSNLPLVLRRHLGVPTEMSQGERQDIRQIMVHSTFRKHIIWSNWRLRQMVCHWGLAKSMAEGSSSAAAAEPANVRARKASLAG